MEHLRHSQGKRTSKFGPSIREDTLRAPNPTGSGRLRCLRFVLEVLCPINAGFMGSAKREMVFRRVLTLPKALRKEARKRRFTVSLLGNGASAPFPIKERVKLRLCASFRGAFGAIGDSPQEPISRFVDCNYPDHDKGARGWISGGC